jgi:hypothetical protein
MNLRRIAGGGLVALLLLSMALPAMCGQCRAVAADASCADRHGSTGQRHQGSQSMAANCDSCGDQFSLQSALHKVRKQEINSARRAVLSCASAVGAAVATVHDGFRDLSSHTRQVSAAPSTERMKSLTANNAFEDRDPGYTTSLSQCLSSILKV